MKKIKLIVFTVVLLGAVAIYAQPTIEWKKCLGTGNEEYAKTIQHTSDGGYILAGHVGVATLNNNFLVVKLTNNGSIEWQQTYGGSLLDEANDIKQTSDGGYIVVGYTRSTDGDVINNNNSTFSHDYWVVKLSSLGIIEWQKAYGCSSDYDEAHEVQQTNDGGYLVLGESNSNCGDVSGNKGSYDIWLVRLSSNGQILWQKTLGGSKSEEPHDFYKTSDGGFVIVGETSSNDIDVNGNHGEDDAWVVKIDTGGNILWQKCLGGSGDDRAYSIQQTFDGGYIVGGMTESNDGDVSGLKGDRDFWAIKLSSIGDIQWQKTLGGTLEDIAYSVLQSLDGNYVLVGYTRSNNVDVTGNKGAGDYWVVKIDALSNILWQKCLGGSANDEANEVLQTTDGGYILVGKSSSNNGDADCNFVDMWVVKLSGTVGIEEAFSHQLNLHPNPANNMLHITTGEVNPQTIAIYNLNGQKLSEQTFNPKIDISQLIPGMYLIELKTEGAIGRKRFVKM